MTLRGVGARGRATGRGRSGGGRGNANGRGTSGAGEAARGGRGEARGGRGAPRGGRGAASGRGRGRNQVVSHFITIFSIFCHPYDIV